MIRYAYFPEPGLAVLKAWEPFSLDELIVSGRASFEAEGSAALVRPTVFDFRAVDLVRQSARDFQALIMRRRALSLEDGNNPIVFVVRDLGSFGMMRMYSVYADVHGLREERQVEIVYDLDEAIDWVFKYLRRPADTALCEIRAEVEGWTPGGKNEPH